MPPGLLPKQTDDFHSKQYWQTFFERRGDESFEWYGSYAELRAIVVDEQKLRRTDRVLVVGCGNSDFSAELYDDGYEEVTNVDFEATVISAMAARNESRTKMSWLVADMTAMVEVATGAVDVVFDKGALDALASSDTPAVRAQVDRFFAEVKRVLAPRGRYVCVSLAQEHITRWWVDGFARGAGRWRTAAHANARAAKQSPYLPFVLVAASPACGEPFRDGVGASVTVHFDEKGRGALPAEIAIDSADGAAADAAPFLARIASAQYFWRQQHELSRVDPARATAIQMDLWAADALRSDGPRYTLIIVDVVKLGAATNPCAVLLIPQGREHEYLFASDDGLRQVGDSAGCSRLIAVRFNRGHEFGDIEDVKAELSSIALELAPPGRYATPADGLDASASVIPFLALGGEDAACPCRVVARGELGANGAYIVEEHDDGAEGAVRRRLIFLDNQSVVQTEVRLAPEGSLGGPSPTAGGPKHKPSKKKGAGKKKGAKKERARVEEESKAAHVAESDDAPAPVLAVDNRFVCFAYHRAMIAGMSLVAPLLNAAVPAGSAPDPSPGDLPAALVIGLGGGALPTALAHFFARSLRIFVCELEEAVVSIAQSWFGFEHTLVGGASADPFLPAVLVADGIEVVETLAAAQPPRPPTEPAEGAPPPPPSSTEEARGGFAALLPSTPLAIVIIDVDSKDPSIGMSCPPKAFVTPEYLASVRSVLRADGMLVVNVAARSSALFVETLSNVQAVFATVYELRASDEDINRTLFAMPSAEGSPSSAPSNRRRGVAIERWLSNSSLFRGSDPLELVELAERLHLTTAPPAEAKHKGKKNGRR